MKKTFASQVRGLPPEAVIPFEKPYADEEVTLKEILEFFHEQKLIYKKFKNVNLFGRYLRKYWNFKQYQSHDFIIDSDENMKLWDWAKNSAEGIDPARLTLRSGKAAFFKCPAGIHNSEKRKIYNHTAGKSCSKCKYEAMAEARSTPIKGVNDLATKRPDLVPFWSDRNEKTPDEVCYGAKDKYLFIGQNGFEYPNAVRDRVKRDSDWCPFSSWQRRMPSHYEVYSFIRNLLPDWVDMFTDQEILPSSGFGPQQNQVDIYIPFFRIAIEVNGDEHLDYGAEYHDSKVDRAEQIGVTLHQVWVSTWNDGTNQWQNKLKNIFEANLSYMTGTSGDKVVPFDDIEIKENIIYRNGDAA